MNNLKKKPLLESSKKDRKSAISAKSSSIPKELLSLVPHLIEDFYRLRRRFRRKTTRQDHLWNSIKRKRSNCSKQKDNCYRRIIEIEVCKDNLTRLEAIALPSKRKLSSLKTTKVFENFSKERKTHVNELIVQCSEASKICLTKNSQNAEEQSRTFQSVKFKDRSYSPQSEKVKKRLQLPQSEKFKERSHSSFREKHVSQLSPLKKTGVLKSDQKLEKESSKKSQLSPLKNTGVLKSLHKEQLFDQKLEKEASTKSGIHKMEGNKSWLNAGKLTEINLISQMKLPNFENQSSKYDMKNISNESLKKKMELKKVTKFLERKQHQQKEDSVNNFFKKLSKPKLINFSESNPSWKLTNSMKNYVPSERLLQIAQPKTKFIPPLSLSEILKVKTAALHYEASNRIKELAEPTSLPEKNPQDPYEVSQAALNANITNRINELAHPKKRTDRSIRKYPFKVSRKALYAKTTRHIIELARPKELYANP